MKTAEPKGAMIVLPGGHGGMQITPSGRIGWGETIFFVRNRETLARQNVHVLLLDAPSDKQAPPFLSGHRQRTDHFSDLRAIMRWIRS